MSTSFHHIKEQRIPLLICLFSVLVTWWSTDIGMFWDNVLFASKMGTAIYENQPFSWRIPVDFDPGHPPFLATIMALGWKIFGRSLAVSHWMMLPFVIGMLWQLFRFVSFFIMDKTWQFWAFLLLVCDPTLLSQLVLVNPEPIQLFFFFLAINGISRHNNLLKGLGLAFLGLVTYRGMMFCAGIFFIDAVINIILHKKTFKSFFSTPLILVYTLGALPAGSFVAWRLLDMGWLQTHPDSPWAGLWHFVDLKGLARNIAVLSQRYLDFGRFTLIAVVFIALYIRRKSLDHKVFILLIMAILSTIVIAIVSLISTNSMGHRYFIPSFLVLELLAVVLLSSFKIRKSLYALCLVSLFGGNFLVYSDSFSQGWDASLAHLPYWDLRAEAIDFMDESEIEIASTASFFPNCVSIDQVELNGDMREFQPFTGEEKFVFYSSVYNLNDHDLDQLKSAYKVIKSFENQRVRVDILQKMEGKY